MTHIPTLQLPFSIEFRTIAGNDTQIYICFDDDILIEYAIITRVVDPKTRTLLCYRLDDSLTFGTLDDVLAWITASVRTCALDLLKEHYGNHAVP